MLNEFFEKVKRWGQTGKASFLSYKKRFQAASTGTKALYILLAGALGTLGALVLNFLHQYRGILVFLLLLWLFTKAEKFYSATFLPTQAVNVWTDEMAVYFLSVRSSGRSTGYFKFKKAAFRQKCCTFTCPFGRRISTFLDKSHEKRLFQCSYF